MVFEHLLAKQYFNLNAQKTFVFLVPGFIFVIYFSLSKIIVTSLALLPLSLFSGPVRGCCETVSAVTTAVDEGGAVDCCCFFLLAAACLVTGPLGNSAKLYKHIKNNHYNFLEREWLFFTLPMLQSCNQAVDCHQIGAMSLSD